MSTPLCLQQEAVLTPPTTKPSKLRKAQPSTPTNNSNNSSSGQSAGATANGGMLALLLGDEGEFVRDILLDELAKVNLLLW